MRSLSGSRRVISLSLPKVPDPGRSAVVGIKTQLQFGKLFVTGVLANQRSQRQSLGLQGGCCPVWRLSSKRNDYEENRHFLLAQYFRNNYQ